MGKFAKKIIKNVIKELNKDFPSDKEYLKMIIVQIGEPLIRNQILNLFYEKFPEDRIDDVDQRIAFLEKQLASTKKLKN